MHWILQNGNVMISSSSLTGPSVIAYHIRWHWILNKMKLLSFARSWCDVISQMGNNTNWVLSYLRNLRTSAKWAFMLAISSFYIGNRSEFLTEVYVTLNTWVLNTLRPRQNGRHFAEDTFKRIFFNENVWISIKISLTYVPKGPIYNIPALVQIMAWRRPGDKPLFEPMMDSLPTHICVTQRQWVKVWCWWYQLKGK